MTNMFHTGYKNKNEMENIQENILVLLETQHDNFPAIKNFLKEKGLNQTTLFLPQTLKSLAEEITHRSDLIIECLNYLDIVKIYSLITYNDSERFTNTVIDIVTTNRIITETNLVINISAIDDFIFSSKEDMQKFLCNNKFLISLYIFSMINTIFYKLN